MKKEEGHKAIHYHRFYVFCPKPCSYVASTYEWDL